MSNTESDRAAGVESDMGDNDEVQITAQANLLAEREQMLAELEDKLMDLSIIENIEKLNKTASNCPGLMTPSCKTTIFTGVSESARRVDRAKQDIHNDLIAGISAVAKLAPAELTPEWEAVLI